MRNPVAAVLMTRVAIPHPKLGSWTGMFEVMLGQPGQPIDYLVCPAVEPARRARHIEYIEASDTSVPLLRRYAPGTRFVRYFSRIRALAETHEHLVLLVVDDYNLLFSLGKWLSRSGLRERTTVVFFIHGMSYFFSTERGVQFYRNLDEIVYLTHASYALERSRTSEMPCEASVVWNGVDKAQFAPVDRVTKDDLRRAVGIDPESTLFLWLSQDRPKKGLQIVLRAWEIFARDHENVQLAVVGARQTATIDNVKWFGVIPHRDVGPYVQMSDIYLFPSLWPEGFGLSVAEALSADLLTIASDIGPMSEVLDNGRYGCLVREPHVVEHWVTTMDTQFKRYIANGRRNPFDHLERDRYSIDVWCREMSTVVKKWKDRAGSRAPAPMVTNATSGAHPLRVEQQRF